MDNLRAILVILLAFVIAYWLRFGFVPLSTDYLLVVLLGMLLASFVLPATGAFRQEFRWESMRRVRRLLAGWSLVITALIVLSALFKSTAVYSRIWFGNWVLLGAGGLVIEQMLVHAWRRRSRGHSKRTLVLVGSGNAARMVEERLAGDGGNDYSVVARFGESWSDHATQVVGELENFVSVNAVDDVWVALPLGETRLLETTLEQLKNCLVDIHVIPDLDQYRMLNQGVSEWAGLPFINISGIPMTGAELALKHMADRLGALILVVVGSPLLLAIALGVRLSSRGPVFFRQQRHGFGGELISVLKFRTMKVHKEAANQVTQATPDDERVTGFGRFLRSSSLDELPQLFNVLKGQMSLVGPRPHAMQHNEFYMGRIPRYMLRHRVRPGITGWAQVNGFRGITDSDDKMVMRIEHDLWYIQNWSLWLDLQILFRTPFAMIGRNAF